MKRIIPLLLLAISVLGIHAQRPERIILQGVQPTGELLNIYKGGNAQVAFFSTTDDYVVIHETDGAYYYATLTSHGLAASSRLAHNLGERDAEEQEFLANSGVKTADAYVSPQVMRSPLKATALTTSGLGEYGKSAKGVVPSIGAVTIPVIMVEFADVDFQAESTMEKVSRYLNEEGYHDEANTVGSVRDYFLDQSAGLFQPSFQVVAKVKASRGYAYYGANKGTTRDVNLQTLIKEAIDSAVVQGVDFSPMLVNGKVPLVTILFAGPAEHNSREEGYENYLWAQFNTFSYKSSKGGPTFSGYFIGDELMQSYSASVVDGKAVYTVTGQRFEGMGVFCHEFGHALGLPDFYNTGTGDGVIDFWSVMDYGQYYLNGYRPIGYNAYERNFMGWLQINDLGADQQVVTIYPLGSGDHQDQQAYRVVNPADEREYYILENRQEDTWYPSRLGTGLLAIHVDYLSTAWSGNTVNRDTKHPRFQVFPADGTNQVYATLRNNGVSLVDAYAQFASDVFPGTDNVTTIATFPTFTGDDVATPMYNIAVNDDKSLTLQYLDLPQPAGTFVRIKSRYADKYIGAAESEQRPLVAEDTEADIFYVTPEGQILSYQQGYFLSAASHFAADMSTGAGAEFAFGVSEVPTQAAAGTYSIRTSDAAAYFTTDGDCLSAAENGEAKQSEFVLETVETLPVVLNETSGYASFSLPIAFTVPDDVKVFFASAVNEDIITLTESNSNTVAAHTPVMLYREGGGTVYVELAASGTELDGNLLLATRLGGSFFTDGEKPLVYGFDKSQDETRFFLLGDASASIPAFQAYYLAPTADGLPASYRFGDDATTGLHTLMPVSASTLVYTLDGRPVSNHGNLPSGIYIVKNGQSVRKILIP